MYVRIYIHSISKLKPKQKSENINNNNYDDDDDDEKKVTIKCQWQLYENYIHIAKYIMSAQSVNETLAAWQGEHTYTHRQGE